MGIKYYLGMDVIDCQTIYCSIARGIGAQRVINGGRSLSRATSCKSLRSEATEQLLCGQNRAASPIDIENST